jgi:hypothetical protein
MSMTVPGSDHSANAGKVTPYRIPERYPEGAGTFSPLAG